MANNTAAQRKLSIDQMTKLVEMSAEDNERPKIAREMGVTKKTVWKYQKLFRLA